MAFTTLFKLVTNRVGPAGSDSKVYGIHFPVTTFSSNLKQDVMVVQAQFRIFYYEFMGFGSIDPPAATTGVIKVDGIVGKQTRIHINHFQQHLLKKGLTKTTDGVIDPFKKQGVLTTRTKVQFQLVTLNAECLRLAFDNGTPEVHQRMIDFDVHAADVYPQELRDALRVTQFLV